MVHKTFLIFLDLSISVFIGSFLFCRFCQAALVTNKYHLGLTLIRKVKVRNDLSAVVENGQNLAHILAKSTKPESSDSLITVVGVSFLVNKCNLKNYLHLFSFFFK